MAKVTAPLFSMGASGQLGKSLVYMTWKGIDDVRIYVKPANPNTAGQQTQRGYFDTAVGLWHSVAFNVADKTAFNLWAAQAAMAMSGFNRFVKAVVDCLVAGSAWESISALVVSGIAATDFDVAAVGATGNTYTLKIGTSPSTMNTTVAVVNTGGALTANPTGLSAATTYYFQISDTTAVHQGYTGIVKVKTLAA